MYDGAGDLDDHIDYFDQMLRYWNDEAKCKIFPATFTKATLAWYWGLQSNWISYWSQFTELFSTQFMVSRVKPKSEKVLKAIHRGENESLREYMKRFNDKALNVKNLDNKIRWWFMENGLWPGSLFKIDVGFNQPWNLKEFLHRSSNYMDHKRTN